VIAAGNNIHKLSHYQLIVTTTLFETRCRNGSPLPIHPLLFAKSTVKTFNFLILVHGKKRKKRKQWKREYRGKGKRERGNKQRKPLTEKQVVRVEKKDPLKVVRKINRTVPEPEPGFFFTDTTDK